MATSSASLDYPSSGEYNVLVQRFKLLNLVQRVAHRDVMEMIDTVGLEGLSRKGTLSKWVRAEMNEEEGESVGAGRGMRGSVYGSHTAQRSEATRRQNRFASSLQGPSHRTSPQRSITATKAASPRMAFGRPTTGFEARVAAAQWNRGVEEEGRESEEGEGAMVVNGGPRRGGGAGRRGIPAASSAQREATRRKYVVRRTQRVLRSSPADRAAFFERLAEPRERPEPVVEDVFMYDAEEGGEAGDAHRGRRVGGGGGGGAARAGRRTPPAPAPYHDQGSAGYASPLEASRHYHGSQQQQQSAFDAGDLRAHYYQRTAGSPLYAPPPPRLPATGFGSQGFPGEGRYDRDFPSARGEGAEDRRVERREGNVEEDAAADASVSLPAALPPAPSWRGKRPDGTPLEAAVDAGEAAAPHEMDFTPPPTRPGPAASRSAANAVAAAAASSALSASADGLGRRRSVNFALSDDDDGYDGASPNAAIPEEVLAATAPAAYARGRTQQPGFGGGGDNSRGGAPAVPQLRFPPAGDAEGDEASTINLLNFPSSARNAGGGAGAGGGAASSPTSAANSPGGLKGRSASAMAGLPKSPRVGRGLAPKAKPKAALGDSQVPVEAVRHAAALMSRSSSTPASGASPATSTPGNSYAAAAKAAAAAQRSSPAPQVSSARTPPATSAFSSGGILVSPRPNTVNVNADRRHLHAEDMHFPEAPVRAAHVATPSLPVTAAVAPAAAPPSSAVAVGEGGVASSGPLPVNEAAQQSFQAVSTRVDHMLQNLQRMLQGVFKDGDEPPRKAIAEATRRKAHTRTSSSGEGNYASSFEESDSGGDHAADAARLADDSLDRLADTGEEDESAEDEMLLYTRIQHKVSRLGAEMNHFALPPDSDEGESSEKDALHNAAARAGAAQSPQQPSPPSGLAQAGKAGAPRRARGSVPDAVVQRLCAYRMEHFQYIACNERLWNTSTTSQFVFAQRLTAALLEECWAEVMTEVDANMSEYVEGLLDHELQ